MTPRTELVCRTQLDHVILSSFPGDGRGNLMSFLTIHFDDSGTHPESTIAVAGCYASTVEQWKEFERNWNDIKQREGFEVFHMADFASGHKEFKGWSDTKKRRVLDAVCSAINLRARAGYAVAITKHVYDEVIVPDTPMRAISGDFHYTFALRQCATRLSMWRKKYYSNCSMKYVFDQMGSDHGKGEIMTVMNAAVKKSASEAKENGTCAPLIGFSFENKAAVLPLQAADILAWTVLQQMHKKQSNRKVNWVADYAWARLSSERAPAEFYPSFFVKSQLEAWREEYIKQLYALHLEGKFNWPVPDDEDTGSGKKRKHDRKSK